MRGHRSRFLLLTDIQKKHFVIPTRRHDPLAIENDQQAAFSSGCVFPSLAAGGVEDHQSTIYGTDIHVLAVHAEASIDGGYGALILPPLYSSVQIPTVDMIVRTNTQTTGDKGLVI